MVFLSRSSSRGMVYARLILSYCDYWLLGLFLATSVLLLMLLLMLLVIYLRVEWRLFKLTSSLTYCQLTCSKCS